MARMVSSRTGRRVWWWRVRLRQFLEVGDRVLDPDSSVGVGFVLRVAEFGDAG